MSRTIMSNDNLSTVLRALMSQHREGSITISELARRTQMARSTIHRHLNGENVSREAVSMYANVFDVPETMLLATLNPGLPTPSQDTIALAMELSGLDARAQEVVWHVVNELKMRTLPAELTQAPAKLPAQEV